ncbi:hypothetical protein A3H26_03310 [candidate division WWE3 bacterium RIFCSPLOWO2_12_FULL_36_10]|uniref:SpoVT-AbrB domain-containing protein n=1 Tax=candidate division WWE3 bacterium RIFCSPLOWO2_12_FULL_36_10 TaxID=1802630 RepID=A0A1F4VJJ2_UNCKA|nr:MAG: hypothetical protein A3H26_03310 [candidate division WWE3 bacterium RIFCSPLOWO2_12_FULL_36_10]
MKTTSISKKGQVVVPKTIRDALNIMPSDRIEVTMEDNKIIMRPFPQTKDVYGSFKTGGEISKEQIKKAISTQRSKKFINKSLQK